MQFNTISTTIPAMKSVAEDPKYVETVPFAGAVLPILDAGAYQGNLTDPDQLAYEIVYPTILDAIQGNQTAEEAANSIHEAANQMVDAAQ
jgi:ABC-type glycerol-3-phosphate transport system substrate-binding protein